MWTIVVFGLALAFAYSPNIIEVYNLLDDYDVLYFKRTKEHYFLHLEAEHLFSVARPLAALLTNLPILPIQSADDFRWFRLFALLTAVGTGTLLMANCIVRLRVRSFDAVALAVSIFSGFAFIYAILDATAWVPHLLTALITCAAYTVLGRSNLQALSLLHLFGRGDRGGFFRQALRYFTSRDVVLACLVYQLAFYDYPPYALLFAIFPVIGILFSQAPKAYRVLIAWRDVAFLAGNLIAYTLSANLLYLPLVRLFTLKGTGRPDAYENEFVASLYAGHQYRFNLNLAEIWNRLESLVRIAGDLWLVPQGRMHLLTGALILLVLVMANAHRIAGRRGMRGEPLDGGSSGDRIRLDGWMSAGASTVAIVLACFAMATSPVVASLGGFVKYRTSVAPTAVVAVVFIFAVRALVEMAHKAIGSPIIGPREAGTAATLLVAVFACGANFYWNRVTATLGRNELAYFSRIVDRAIVNRSRTIVLIDPRPFELDMSRVYDETGRWLPPHELASFSSYRMQTGAIIRILAAGRGLSYDAFEILIPRGDSPVPGLTCGMLTAEKPFYPAGASQRSIDIINYYRTLTPLTCEMVSMAWHDLSWEDAP
ncbi:MAG: hypothetical protein KIT25_10570 [Enhydrobacter sp.]|nr:MAG: hypothetical protein KIT25_10570 [Enhydrobacter sp.]